jgi:hypothetical protein
MQPIHSNRPLHPHEPFPSYLGCCNPSLGLATKARACKVTGQEGIPGVTPHVPRSVRKCEVMNPHTPKGASDALPSSLLDSSWVQVSQTAKLFGTWGMLPTLSTKRGRGAC